MASLAYLVMAAMYGYCVWSLGRMARSPEEDASRHHANIAHLVRYRKERPSSRRSLAADQRAGV